MTFINLGPATWLGRFWVASDGFRIREVQFGTEPAGEAGDDPAGREAVRQIVDFLEADRRGFDLALDWTVLPPAHAAILKTLYHDVPWGQYVTYGELAAMAGLPRAARAAGQACRMNPFAVIVPAHRVIATGERIGGFQGRPDIKRRLLAREGLGPFRD